ncbi:ankyrin repeat domain-containing protein [bacterium]|nr:ankyrin repeat domain-containing protein [bacterium]
MSTVSPKIGSNNVSTSSVNLDHESETKTADNPKTQASAPDAQAKPFSEGAKQARVAEHNLSSFARQAQIAAIPVATKRVAAKAIDHQLMEAAKNNDLKKMEDLIKQGANVNSADDKGRTPLMYAAQAGSQQAIEKLVKNHHADVNARDVNDQTALMKSAIMGKNDGVRFLLDNKAKIDAYDKFGRTALTYSARQNHTEVLKTLLHKNADPNIRDEDGRSPLMEAAAKGNPESVKELIRHNADVDAQTDRSKSTALMDAIDNGNPEVIRMLARRSDPDLKDNQGNTPLMYMLRSLPDGGAADPAAVQSLIQRSKDLDTKNNNGRTAMMEAGRSVDSASIKALIDRGADPNIQDQDGKTALMDLIETSKLKDPVPYFDAINTLAANADLNLRDTSGRTALIQAAMRNDNNTLKALRDQGADMNIADNHGKTALMEAAQKGFYVSVRELMDVDAANPKNARKADPFMRDENRGRALEMAEFELRKDPAMDPAKRKFYEDIINLLKKEMDI